MHKKERDLQTPFLVCPVSLSLQPCCFETVLFGFLKGSQENSVWDPLLIPLKTVARLPMTFIGSGHCSLMDWNGERLPVLYLFCSLSDTPHPAKEILYSSETCRTVPAAAAFVTCNHNHIATTAAATSMALNQIKAEPTPALSCNPAHPLLHINTLYEDHEEEVSNMMDNGIHSPTGEMLSMPTPKQIRLATFDEPMAMVSSVEY